MTSEEIIDETSTEYDIPANADSVVVNAEVADRYGDNYTVNDTYNNNSESYSELEAYNGYRKRLNDGEEIHERIYDQDYNADATEYYIAGGDDISLCVGEVITLDVISGSSSTDDKGNVTPKVKEVCKDLPSLIYVVTEEDQKYIRIIDSNKIEALKDTAGETVKVHVYNTLNDFEAVANIKVVSDRDGKYFDIVA